MVEAAAATSEKAWGAAKEEVKEAQNLENREAAAPSSEDKKDAPAAATAARRERPRK